MTPAHDSLALEAADGHRWQLYACSPAEPVATVLWLPALGVGARHYLPFAQALAKRGMATFLHEWRGAGSSSLRAGHDCNWGYRELLELDIAASADAVDRTHPGLPSIIGGHSLGGQLASCRLALAPDTAQQLWLVGSGAPYWRAFPLPHRPWLPLAYRFLPWLADRNGALPGRRLRFGGREARGVMRDWSRTALTGTYAADGLDTDLEAGMARVQAQVSAVVFERDWLAPPSSLQHLLSRLPQVDTQVMSFDDGSLGVRADHFQWIRAPGPVADWLSR
ncbi:alpha/beta hydrolase family protein [Luteimonas sp. A277]